MTFPCLSRFSVLLLLSWLIHFPSSTSAFSTTSVVGRRPTVGLSALTSPAVAEGEREILDGPNGPVLVTKVAGNYYAVDATCPHLGLPMKKGKISVDEGTPTLTCNFHNSCFSLETGACTKWVTGALGVKSGLIAGIMGKVGGEQKDIKAYTVTENEDGSLTIE